MSKSAPHYSFAVGSKYGPRSARWIITVSGNDIYVSTAKDRHEWHASLHKSGRWHIKNLRAVHADRKFVQESHRDLLPKGEYPIGLFILVPDNSLRPASDPDRTSVPDAWLERPPHDGMTEIAIAKWNISEIQEPWPGASVGTKFEIIYKVDDENVIGVLVRQLAHNDPIAVHTNEGMQRYMPTLEPIRLDSPERRGYMFFKSELGALVIVEFAID